MTGEEVGPTFGESVANSALIAMIASLLVISVYIALRFEWKYAVPVLIALMHDILITAGVYALLGREVTTSTVAALLTIVGFSLYDTIIVFDRIRENVPRMPSAAFSQIVNRSMSEVIVRSLATSFCTILPVLALFLFGGDTLKDFAFALIVGTVSGAYSSVFIAGPVLTHWKDREQVYRTRERRIRKRARLPARLRRADGQRAGRRRAGRAARRPPQRHRPAGPDRRVAGGVRRDGARPRDRGGAPARRHRRDARPPGRRSPRPRQRRPDRLRPGARRRRLRHARPTSPTARARRGPEAQEAAQPQAREAALMAMLVWAMMGIALWHFTVFLPDRFWGGIVGAFLGALFGAIIIGLAVNGFTVPGQDDTTLASALEAIPGAHRRHRGRLLPRRPPGQRSRLGPARARPAPAGAGCDRGLERVAGGVDLVDDQARSAGWRDSCHARSAARRWVNA